MERVFFQGLLIGFLLKFLGFLCFLYRFSFGLMFMCFSCVFCGLSWVFICFFDFHCFFVGFQGVSRVFIGFMWVCW